jgi:hypothetical protein
MSFSSACTLHIWHDEASHDRKLNRYRNHFQDVDQISRTCAAILVGDSDGVFEQFRQVISHFGNRVSREARRGYFGGLKIRIHKDKFVSKKKDF